jgi:hypothetical protein
MARRSFSGLFTHGRPVLFKLAAIGLLAWSALAFGQAPSETDGTTLLERGRKAALDYSLSLPDFVCTEVVYRYTDPYGGRQFVPAGAGSAVWNLTDTLTVQLGYFEHKEEHKLTLIDGKPTNRTYDSLGGAVDTGEFGGMLHSIFNPASQAGFRWVVWKNVRRRRAAVYSYVVEQPHSSYRLVSRGPGEPQMALVGYHGELDIDQETGAVLSFTYEADSIPKSLQWDSAITTVNYDFTAVGGRSYLLPASAETVMRGPVKSTRNHMEFRHYGKFSSDSVVTFGDAK